MATKKPRVRNATPLDRFTPVDFENLQFVADNGRLTMEFDTPNQAINTKARLFRLKESLQAYQPNDPLAKASKFFVFKINKTIVTIIDRMRSPEIQVQRQSMVKQPPITADPGEVDWSQLDQSIFGEGHDDKAS